MSYEEELIFGLTRYLKKCFIYLDNRSFKDFFNDEKSFDATMYCFSIIEELASKINKIDSLKEKYSKIDFNELSSLNKKILYEDNYNLNAIYDLISKEFIKVIQVLESKKEEDYN